MRKLIPTLTLVITLVLPITPALVAPSRADVVTAQPADERCAELAKHPAVVRRRNKEWKTPIDATGESALRVWDTTCRDWQKRHRPIDAMDAADIEYNLERQGLFYRSTTSCRSTWHHGSYSSQLTTTCTSY